MLRLKELLMLSAFSFSLLAMNRDIRIQQEHRLSLMKYYWQMRPENPKKNYLLRLPLELMLEIMRFKDNQLETFPLELPEIIKGQVKYTTEAFDAAACRII